MGDEQRMTLFEPWAKNKESVDTEALQRFGYEFVARDGRHGWSILTERV
jgi:hypothetical protein